MHHKFLVIDDIKVITGSFNWTRQANKSNMENIMIVEDQNIAKEYRSEFDRIWQLIASRGIENYLKDDADIIIEDTEKKDDADIMIEDTETTVKIETVQKSTVDKIIDKLDWVHNKP
jgi:phosphatidylserine/phosphatidylglycerophosphate/cardiolipin synthase-like enzyme